jgi:hypothetical protein
MQLRAIIRKSLQLRYAAALSKIAHLSDALKRTCCKCARKIIIETDERLAEAMPDAADARRVR